MNCLACQSPSAPGSRFCSRCGAKLARPCGGCGHESLAGAHFCEGCGRPLEALAQAGDRRIVTILFTDVSGFTSMSEKLDPQTVTALVNRFFTVLTRPIYRYGGVVDKYIGDAIMALFGAPLSHEDDPERAMAAAWEMKLAAEEFAANLEAKSGIRLKVRIGLNTGLVVAGGVGTEQKRDYTVLGDAVNVAAQMEAHARPGSILVSEETFRLTRHGWECLELPPVHLKGSDRAVRVYEPQGPRRAAPDEDRVDVPFVGRELELLTLEGELDQALQGEPRGVRLVGEAGLGKSRLVKAFVERKAERGIEVLQGRALSYRQEVSYSLIASVLGNWMGLAERDLDLAHLEDWCCRQGLEEPERKAELLGHFLGLSLRSAELAQLSAETLKNLAWQTLHALILRPGSRARILALHDVQWADEASGACLAELAHAARESGAIPLLWVVHGRPGAEAMLELPLEMRRIALQPLPEAEAEELLGALLELAAPPEGELAALLGRVRARAEGNPLFLGELVRMLIATGVLQRKAEGWSVQEAPGFEALPTTLRGLLASRLDRLSPGTRQVAQVAAVLGRDFPASLLAEASQAEAIGEALAELVDSELIHARSRQPGTFAFNQVLLQEALYQGILVKVRRELHRRVGLLLEERAAYQSTEMAPTLAFHFRRAEDLPRAIRYLYQAGRYAQGRFDLTAALHDFGEALALLEQTSVPPASPDRATVLAALAEVEATLGRYPDALQHLESALGLASRGGDRAQLLRQMGGVYERLGTYERAIASYEDALTLLEPGAVIQRAGLLGALAYAEYGLGRYESALCRLEAAMPDLADATAQQDLAFCHSVLGLTLTRQGHSRRAIDHHEAALKLRESLEDMLGAGSSCNNLSQVYYELGEFETARGFIERAIAAFARVGDQSWLAMGHNNLGLMLLERHELAEAEERFRQALAICRRIGFASRLGGTLCNLGEALAKQGRHEAAIAHLQEGVQSLETLHNDELLPQAYRSLAEVLLDSQLAREAWNVVVKAMRLNHEVRHEVQQGVLYALAGTVFSQAGQHASALSWISRAIAILQRSGHELELARAWQRMARALLAGGQPTHAAAAALKARQSYRALEATYELARLESWLKEVSPAPVRR